MKSLKYLLTKKPSNFSDLEDYCSKYSVPEQVVVSDLYVLNRVPSVLGFLEWFDVFKVYDFGLFKFKQVYGHRDCNGFYVSNDNSEALSFLEGLGVSVVCV